MSNTEYSLYKLWPEWERLFAGDITSPEGLSALVVFILFGVAIFFLIITIKSYFQAKFHLRFYRKLLKGITVDELPDKRRDINNKALKSKAYGRLWREFDESLVHVPQKNRLCNTLDAAHFFNTHTIARGLTENRLLSAVPGFLTAFGVIGTFAGLQMGLAELKVDSEDFNTLKTGIAGLIGGASIAFMTSVWGVLTSVAFNLVEKIFERSVRGSISSFQNEVDYLYPRITAEESLSKIESYSKQSTDKLAELDEKIGKKMQEAMSQASEVIRDGMEKSLNTILGPAIEQLVANAHTGSEKALETVLERFLEGVGSAGDAQRKMMEQAAAEVASASGGMANGLSDFTKSLESQINVLIDRSSEVLTKMESNIHQQMDEQQNREMARQKVLNDQFKNFQAAQADLSQTISGVMDTQKEQHGSLSQQMSDLIQRFSELAKEQNQATSAMQQAAGDMKSSSNQLGMLSGNVKQAVDELGNNISSAAILVSDVSEKNSQTFELFDELFNQVSSVHDGLKQVVQTLSGAAEKANNGFVAVGSHFDSLSQSLKQHISDLEDQVTGLLNSYSSQVQDQTRDRMNVWNEQTSNYIGSMTDAVRALNDVVDEIDTKVGSSRSGSLV